MLRGLPQLTISPTHNSSPNDLTLATSLSRHTYGYALSPRLARPRLLVGAWLEPRPASRYTGSFAERGWSHAPGGSVCRAAAQAAAQSELGQCPDLRTKRKATTVPRRSRRTGLFGAWLEPRPRGLGVSSCGSSRSSKRAWPVPGSEDEEEVDDGAVWEI